MKLVVLSCPARICLGALARSGSGQGLSQGFLFQVRAAAHILICPLDSTMRSSQKPRKHSTLFTQPLFKTSSTLNGKLTLNGESCFPSFFRVSGQPRRILSKSSVVFICGTNHIMHCLKLHVSGQEAGGLWGYFTTYPDSLGL